MSLFPEGYYTGPVRGVALISSNTKGTPGVEVEFEVEGHKKRCQWWLSGAAEQYAIEKMKRIGVNLDTDPPSFSEDEFEWSCKHRPPNDKGQVYEDWDIARGRAEVKPMDSDRIRILKAKLAGTQPGKPKTAPPPAPKSSPPKAPPKPPPGKAKVTTEDEAWEALCKLFPKSLTEDERAAEWEKLIGEVAKKSGREREVFTPADWAAVVDGYVPF